MELKRVVITGIGALTPLGNNPDEYWNGLVNGVSGADFITLFDATKFKTRFACEIKNFDPTQFMDRKEARKIDRFTQLALVASDQAMKDAGNESFGYTEDEIVSSDIIGIHFGSLFDATQTKVITVGDKQLVKTVSWYDNEMSYVSQLVRTVHYFATLINK